VSSVARLLLFPLPLVGGAYVVALTAGAASARPELVWWLVPWPVLAGVLAVPARAWWILAGAFVELAAAVPLHGLLTFVRAWRLEGG
jgi:hypothetical protein